MNEALASYIASSQAQEISVSLLRGIPGMPPITQAIHILGVGVVMGTAVMIDLRILGLAVPSQQLDELVRRLAPWTWWALVINVLTGLPYLLAQPYRYLLNPVFGIKMACLVPAVLVTLLLYKTMTPTGFWEETAGRRLGAKLLAGLSIVLWITVIFGGRWIAYSDYIFWSE